MNLDLITLAQTQTNTGNGQAVAWAVALLGAALLIFFLEAFVPSGGILGFVSGVCAVIGVVLMFGVNTTAGLITSFLVLLAIPFLIGFAMKIYPNTPFGKWVILGNQETNPQSTADMIELSEPESGRIIRVGDRGRTLTPLYPVGTVLINQHREECLAQGDMIDQEQDVQVVHIDGNEIFVRKV
jgi:membrane-bound ClpP family serine protease